MIYALAWTVSSSLHPRLRAEVFANNDLCTFCWPHPSSLPAQLAPDTGGRGKAQLGGKEEGQRGRPSFLPTPPPPRMDPASASRSSHPQEGLSREVSYLGSPTWPQGAPEGRGLGQMCVSRVRVAWLSNRNSHSPQAFCSDLGSTWSAPTSDHTQSPPPSRWPCRREAGREPGPRSHGGKRSQLDLMGCRPSRLPGIEAAVEVSKMPQREQGVGLSLLGPSWAHEEAWPGFQDPPP